MQRVSEAVQKLRQTFNRNNVRDRVDPTHTPLLGSDAVAELKERALGIIDYQTKNKAVLHRQHGEHLSPRRGFGLDYEESRVYQPGDEVRFMNWRLTARTGEPHVKVFLEERQPSAFIMLDRRPSMRFGTRVRLKVTQALRAAILFAFYNHYAGRSMSGLVVEDELLWLASRADEQSILGMINSMNSACPPLSDSHNQCDFESVLRSIQSTLTRGTQVYLISDFIDAGKNCNALLAQLASEHELCAIHIVDPAELQLPKAGRLQLATFATAQARSVDTTNPQIAAQYQRAAQQHLDERESLFHALGINYVRMSTTIDHIENEMAFI
jgi:uncharacterized protein (DUF58 family)